MTEEQAWRQAVINDLRLLKDRQKVTEHAVLFILSCLAGYAITMVVWVW